MWVGREARAASATQLSRARTTAALRAAVVAAGVAVEERTVRDVVQDEAARYASAVTALLRSSFPIASRQEFEDWVDHLAREEITGAVSPTPEAVAV